MRNILSILFIFILIPNIAYAEKHELEDLYIHTYIHEDGSATIQERRKATLSDGTENFIVIENIGKSKITDFNVTEYGQPFEHVDPWDEQGSRADKLFKKGIIETKDGYELVWGIGLYGKHEYILEYTITDFIKQLDDAQILYWYFVSPNTNIPPQNVRIVIEADKELSFDDEKIWAYGFDGNIEFNNGEIIAKSTNAFNKSDYAVVLVKFNENEFATTDVLDQTFAEIKKEADEDKSKEKDKISLFTVIGIFGGSVATVLFLRFIIGKFFSTIFKGLYKLRRMKKAPVKFAGQYVEHIPYGGNFYEIYPLLVKAKISNLDQLMAAYFLKWITEEKIKVEEKRKRGFLREKNEVNIQILTDNNFDHEFEKVIFSTLESAADENHCVNQKELKKAFAKDGQKIMATVKRLEEASQEILHEKGYMEERERFGIGGFRKSYKKTEQGEELERQIFMFMNYLRDYSIVEKSQTKEQSQLDEYIVWAALLGISKEAQAQFASVHDHYFQHSMYYHPFVLPGILDISDSIAYESGAGGSFSGGSGGGGGAFGGGGGGTR